MFKILGGTVLWLVVAFLLSFILVPPFLDRIYYEGEASANFDGERFFNPDEGEGEWEGDPTGRGDGRRNRSSFLVRLILGDDRPEWPEAVAIERAVPERRVMGDRLVVTWVGHSTVLIQTANLNILTDPIWSDHATPFPPLGPRRVSPPGVAFGDLPPIDLVLVSHNHYDHMDLPTLRRLWERDRPLIVTSLGNDSVITQSGAEAVARDWGQRVAVNDNVSVIVTRNHHWGSRWFVDRNRALWSSFVIETPGGNIFFAGDTGPGDMRWPGEAAAYGPVRLALIPIGAFRFEAGQNWSGSHIGPDHAVRVFEALGAAYALGIHWRTFRLSWEAIETPRELLHEHLAEAGIGAGRFRAVPVATVWDVPELSER
ncbi:MAG: Zn-dependent hydrolase [Sphingomonadaceae bacterium]|nr:Zn-dependent hydrolase [Sphingomonadaceae bacterium]